ncbi:MAG: tetratricopeptide repeat protein [Gammaproteobacteria bacterium]|nr:tetratricopeptide repeat protein [Gammaproteobacteria bacterium]
MPAGAEEQPKGLETMRALAVELLRVQDYEGSIEVYREITRHTPDDPKSHYDLAGALSFIRLFDDAVEPITTAIRLDPENARFQEMAALIFLNLERYEEAFSATMKSAELGEPTAMYSLVNMYEKGLGVKADPDKAVYWAEQAAERGHLGAMAILEEAYRTGRFERRVDAQLADQWARRLRAAE